MGQRQLNCSLLLEKLVLLSALDWWRHLTMLIGRCFRFRCASSSCRWYSDPYFPIESEPSSWQKEHQSCRWTSIFHQSRPELIAAETFDSAFQMQQLYLHALIESLRLCLVVKIQYEVGQLQIGWCVSVYTTGINQKDRFSVTCICNVCVEMLQPIKG